MTAAVCLIGSGFLAAGLYGLWVYILSSSRKALGDAVFLIGVAGVLLTAAYLGA